MELSREASILFQETIGYAQEHRYEYIIPEMFLLQMSRFPDFCAAFEECGGVAGSLAADLQQYIDENTDKTRDRDKEPELSIGSTYMIAAAQHSASNSGRRTIELSHLLHAIWQLKDSYAVYYMELQEVTEAELLSELVIQEEERGSWASGASGTDGPANGWTNGSPEGSSNGWAGGSSNGQANRSSNGWAGGSENGPANGYSDGSSAEYDGDGFYYEYEGQGGQYGQGGQDGQYGQYGHYGHYGQYGQYGQYSQYGQDGQGNEASASGKNRWKLYAPCLNETLTDVNPLIGREAEIERTIQILCRKDKNNPLHIGEPGVGKTAITYGLVQQINKDKVPDPLKGSKVFALDLGGMLAGTQYRGDFEKRFKKVLQEIGKEEKPIVYIDEIHNLAGAGAVGQSSFDAGNMLKPYLAGGHIRFIGATTFDEYKKHFEKNRSLARRFQNVEIKEPTEAECVEILKGLKKKYEKYHGVFYAKGVLEYAVSMSAKHISERFLPDKAIDLMDEAGAYRKLHPLDQKRQTVDKKVVAEVLTSICRVPIETVKTDDISGLATLETRLKGRIFGQDEAVSQVVNAVKFSKSGLMEQTQPMASLLFVGPTGVGKTEIARSLAEEMGVKLIRFDMSEYGEKHSIAKLIGSPAGYVGYEEGGILTEAIRKNPFSVLLLDEIEKAHADIYNILLQVMDYATLTDNQGRKADFRNVMLIMTSNAGANRIGKKSIGFHTTAQNSSVVMDEVKRIFQPEFRNRLHRIVVFNGMDDEMASLIVRKKLSELQDVLEAKKIALDVDDKAIELIKRKGVSQEFGAREVDRVIRNEIKPLFVDEILFGKLKKGGRILLTVDNDCFRASARK